MSYNDLNEKELLDLLKHVQSGTSPDHKYKRINSLEELQKRIESNFVENKKEFIDVLVGMAVSQGDSRPEKGLIVKCLSLFIEKDESLYKEILDRLKGKEGLLLKVFSSLVTTLNYENKRMAIKPLVNFLMTRDNINDKGVNEVYSTLLSLGEQNLSKDVVKEAATFLDSIKVCTVLFSVRLCSKFGDQKLLPKMLAVLEKSMDGYFDAYHVDIEREICEYFKRIKHQGSFSHLMKLMRLRSHENPSDKSEALSEILNANLYLMDDVLDALYDAGKDKDLVENLLRAIADVEKPPNPKKLIMKLRIRYWWEQQASYYLSRILVKAGKDSKPVLIELLQDDEKFDYVLGILKEIGVSTEEINSFFPKPIMLQLYNFFYTQPNVDKKMRKELPALWIDKLKLQNDVPGKTSKLEHLVIHILSSFNLVTLNIAPLKIESVDIISFFPETLDLIIIGCTTGVLKDDLAKLDAVINTMEKEMPDIFKLCTVTPVIICSKNAAISSADLKYSRDQGIVILEYTDIERLLEMLNTSRDAREVLKFIKNCQWKYQDTGSPYY